MIDKNFYRIPRHKATYILRYYLPIEPYVSEKITKQRFRELIDFCKENRVEAVMFYVAFKTDWYYQPDRTNHAKKWARQMLPLVNTLREKGISYQLNFQNLLGAVPGGADFRKEYPWDFLTDSSGRENTGCACPLSPHFRENMGAQLTCWAETQPDVIWLDDDFRLHNHGTSAFYERDGTGRGERDWFCYCDIHMELFNRRYGRGLSREELLCKIFSPGSPSDVRKEWLDFLAETMAETAGWVQRIVKKVSPGTLLAQMTSIPDVHAAEGRRWDSFLTELTGGRYSAILRPHFGPYAEQNPLDFVDCMLFAEQLFANISAQYGRAEYCPEIENTRFTSWAKSVAATRYQLYLSQLLGFPGVTLSLYDLEGSPLDEEPEYGRLLQSEKSALDMLASLQLSQWEKQGVVLITDPDNAMKKELPKQGFSPEDLVGIRTWDKILAQLGIPLYYRIPEEVTTEGTLIAVDGNSIHCFSKQQKKALLKKKLLLDGAAAEILWRNGFGGEIGIMGVGEGSCMTSAEIFHNQRHPDQTEKRMPNRMAPMEWKEFLISDAVEVLSTIVLCDGRRVPGLCRFHNEKDGDIWLYPAVGGVEKGFYNHARARQFRDLVEQADGAIPMLYANRPCVTVCRQKDQDILVAVSILSPDGAESVTLHVPTGKKVRAIYRQNGSTFTEIRCEGMEDITEIPLHLPVPALLYEWIVLILKVQ